MPAPESLRCFLEAARLLSFRAAAKSVALSPAAFGQRIRQLEEELDAKLFHRTTRTVVLTEAGLALMPHAQRVLEALDDCGRAARGELGPAPAELTIGTRHELGLSWIVPMLPGIQRDHPWLTLHLYFGSGRDLVAHVRSLAIDCAVTSTRLTDPMLDSARLHEERYVFVGSTKLLGKEPFERPVDAAKHVLVDTTEGLPLFRYWRDAPGGLDSLAFGKILRMGTIAAIRHTLVRGEGVAVLPRYYVQKDIDAGRLTVLLPEIEPISDHFRLVFRSDDPRRGLFDTLAERMRAQPLR